MTTAAQARRDLDAALAAALPLSGGRVRTRIRSLQRALSQSRQAERKPS